MILEQTVSVCANVYLLRTEAFHVHQIINPTILRVFQTGFEEFCCNGEFGTIIVMFRAD
jgi:hypothetical protein